MMGRLLHPSEVEALLKSYPDNEEHPLPEGEEMGYPGCQPHRPCMVCNGCYKISVDGEVAQVVPRPQKLRGVLSVYCDFLLREGETAEGLWADLKARYDIREDASTVYLGHREWTGDYKF